MEETFKINHFGYWREVHISGIPNNSGVFFVYEGRHDGFNSITLNKLIYIDEAANIRGSIIDHPEYGYWLRHVRWGHELCFGTCQVDPKYRERVKTALIIEHPTPENKIPDSFEFDTTNVISTGKTGLLSTNFTVEGYEVPEAVVQKKH